MSSQALLSVDTLTRRFGGLVAVNKVTLDLHLGEVHAVIGTNGAGKSTLINMLSGEIDASEGRITLDGQDITKRAQFRRALAGVGRSYQRTTIFPEFTVLENCRLAAQAAAPKPWAFWQASTRCEYSNAAACEALDAAGLSAVAARVAGTLSHGAKRQLEVAMCLATKPRVLLLDEPLAGMGAEETERMLGLLASLKTSHAILLVEHDMDAVFRIADRITVMVNGTVIASGDPASIRVNPEVRTAYLGEDH
ncbi:ABC transporter ATP-binding protein [Variovorax soli]|uniref:Branched-chain amino acid transport system ATP-binding protein n=1 Tax=Variovorax soli TaxID=376815 RepID=A0ABU1N993_9BURK|nr:ABC transporter ATP-binding protein [Variovorax soli]MDR6534466.1 branched-chain amino acid transport system ATP-binding protein [Variovorax soli]